MYCEQKLDDDAWSEDGSTDKDEIPEVPPAVNNIEMNDKYNGENEICIVVNPSEATIIIIDEKYQTKKTVRDEIPLADSNDEVFNGGDGPYCINDILQEIKDPEIVYKLNLFAEYCYNWVHEKGLTSSYNFSALMQASKIYDLNLLKKEKEEFTVLVALWVVFLRVMKMHMGDNPKYKYEHLEDFLASYDGQFDKIDLREQLKLMDTGNWMAIVLPMVVAKKSKGLIIHVIPKFLEGFHVKYVTGSGQSKKTSNRVAIFEQEGNVQPCKKRKWSSAKEENGKLLKHHREHHQRERSTPHERPERPVVSAVTHAAARHSNRAMPSFPTQLGRDLNETQQKDFSQQDIAKFRRESFYAGPPVLERAWSEDFAHHFDIDIDQLL